MPGQAGSNGRRRPTLQSATENTLRAREVLRRGAARAHGTNPTRHLASAHRTRAAHHSIAHSVCNSADTDHTRIIKFQSTSPVQRARRAVHSSARGRAGAYANRSTAGCAAAEDARIQTQCWHPALRGRRGQACGGRGAEYWKREWSLLRMARGRRRQTVRELALSSRRIYRAGTSRCSAAHDIRLSRGCAWRREGRAAMRAARCGGGGRRDAQRAGGAWSL